MVALGGASFYSERSPSGSEGGWSEEIKTARAWPRAAQHRLMAGFNKADIAIWRTERDSNPRYGRTVCRFSRPVPSTTRPSVLMVDCLVGNIIFKMNVKDCCAARGLALAVFNLLAPPPSLRSGSARRKNPLRARATKIYNYLNFL